MRVGERNVRRLVKSLKPILAEGHSTNNVTTGYTLNKEVRGG